jgi:transcription elongation GreA/GreB family factor
MLKEDSARKNSEITILKEDSDRKIEWFREIGDLIVNAEREQKQLNDKVNEISLNIAQLENYGRAIELARQRRQNALAEK